MIRVALACLLLQSARALAAPASPPHATRGELLPPGRAGLHRDDAPGDLLVRTLWKRNAPSEDTHSDHVSRKQFVMKFLCRKDDKCMHTQVYEFDLLGVKPGAGGNGVYY